MGPLHTVWSLNNRAFQHGSPTDCISCHKNSFCMVSQQRSLLQCGLLTGCSFLQGTSTCSSTGSSMSCRAEICSTVDLYGSRGTNCLTMVVSTGCRRPSDPVPGTPPSLPSLTLVSVRFLLSFLYSHLSHSSCTAFCNPFLHMLPQKHYQHH